MRPTPSCLRIPRPTSAARCSAGASWRSSGTASTSGSSSTGAHGSACTSAWPADCRRRSRRASSSSLTGRASAPPGWPPRFTKLHLTFADGGELVLADGRRLGRVRLRRDPPERSRRSGFSASTRSSSCPRRRDSRRSWPSAAPRSRRFSWTRPSPPASGTGLPTRCSTRRASPPAAARLAVPAGSRSASARDQARRRDRGQAAVGQRPLPKSWLFHHRWGRNAAAVTARGERIRHDTIGDTTAWVPPSSTGDLGETELAIKEQAEAAPMSRTRGVSLYVDVGGDEGGGPYHRSFALPYPTLDTDSHGPSR